MIDQHKNPLQCAHWTTKFKPSSKDNKWKKSFLRPKLEENPPWTNQIALSPLSESCFLLNDTVIIDVLVSRQW